MNAVNANVLKAISEAYFLVMQTDSRQGIKYLDPNLVVKVSRRRYKNLGGVGKPRASWRSETFLVTVGKPGYREREFIKVLKKSKEPFPVKKVQLRAFAPVRKGK